MGIQLMGDISCLLRLLWPRSSLGSASCAWLLTLRLVKIAVKWTLDFLGGNGHSPVSLLTQSLLGPEVSSDIGGSWSFWKLQLSHQGRSIVSAPSPEDGLSLIFFFFPAPYHSGSFLPTTLLINLVLPIGLRFQAFLTRFYGKWCALIALMLRAIWDKSCSLLV